MNPTSRNHVDMGTAFEYLYTCQDEISNNRTLNDTTKTFSNGGDCAIDEKDTFLH